MTSLHLVDPALRPLLAAWPTITLTDATLTELRGRELPFPSGITDGVAVTARGARSRRCA